MNGHYIISNKSCQLSIIFRCSSSDLSLASETDSSWRVGHQPPSSAFAFCGSSLLTGGLYRTPAYTAVYHVHTRSYSE